MITTLQTKQCATVLFIEVGATNVGSIHQTYTPDRSCAKGEEKGYFSFGGSCILLFFEPDKIHFDADLIRNSEAKIETLGLLGQSLGTIV
jgi:phosphatidylserine decarboxylase